MDPMLSARSRDHGISLILCYWFDQSVLLLPRSCDLVNNGNEGKSQQACLSITSIRAHKFVSSQKRTLWTHNLWFCRKAFPYSSSHVVEKNQGSLILIISTIIHGIVHRPSAPSWTGRGGGGGGGEEGETVSINYFSVLLLPSSVKNKLLKPWCKLFYNIHTSNQYGLLLCYQWFIVVYCAVTMVESLSLSTTLSTKTTSLTHPLSLSPSLSNSHCSLSLSFSLIHCSLSPYSLSLSWSRTLLFISSANLALSHSLTIFYGKCDSTKITNSWAWEGNNNNNNNNNNKESHTQHHTSAAGICLPTILTTR